MIQRLLLLLALLCASSAFAASLPPELPLPAGAHPNGADAVIEERYGEAEFSVHGDPGVVEKRGHHWSAPVVLEGAEGASNAQVWAKLRPTIVAAGWTPVFEEDLNPYYGVLKLAKNGRELWAQFAVFGADDIRLEVIEVGAAKLAFALKPPAPTVEKIARETGDFPYLAPLPGSTLASGSYDESPMMVRLAPGSEELTAVGSAIVRRDYQGPKDLSNLLLATAYRDALKAAGWTIVESSQGLHQSDVAITAHYAANGRDIWAYLHGGGSEYSIQVADAGATDLAGALAKSCHVALYGITFDFNQATIKPESEATLGGVLALLKKDASLKLEIEGHTDNIGGAAPNQKLSEARAKAVVDWLVAHGVEGPRLAARGYGLAQPIASNDDAEGRAKNRRVELKKPGCTH